MASFDFAAAIEEFSVDDAQNSMELPHMTTGQRKSAKKLLEQYPDLSCESYGFGSERQLHLFKKNEQNKADWAMFTPIVQKNLLQDASPDRSTTASSDVSSNNSAKGSPATNDREDLFPAKHENFQVRNTFIHIEEASIDARVVQSMPHGMFRQCILAEESSQQATDCNTPSVTGYDTASEPDEEWLASPSVEPHGLAIGTLVVLEGLLKAPAFNGRSGVVQGFDEETARYTILLASPDGCQQAKIKEDNLRVVLPCP